MPVFRQVEFSQKIVTSFRVYRLNFSALIVFGFLLFKAPLSALFFHKTRRDLFHGPLDSGGPVRWHPCHAAMPKETAMARLSRLPPHPPLSSGFRGIKPRLYAVALSFPVIINAFSILRFGPVNVMSLPWCTTRSMVAAASLSSPRTVPHLENSMFVVKTRLRVS